jgi:putative redox protein
MVQIDVTYHGGLRCEAVHGPSRQALFTDAPTDNHGKGEFFSPTDLVAAALGTCIATVMGIVAEREKLDLAGMRITVVKEMATAPNRRIGKLVTLVVMPCSPTEQQRAKLERAAHACPVHGSLRPDTEIPIEFVYPSIE